MDYPTPPSVVGGSGYSFYRNKQEAFSEIVLYFFAFLFSFFCKIIIKCRPNINIFLSNKPKISLVSLKLLVIVEREKMKIESACQEFGQCQIYFTVTLSSGVRVRVLCEFNVP